MSGQLSRESASYVSKEELIAWLRNKIEELEEELRMLREMLSMLEGGSGWKPGEKPEEVKVGRRRIAVVYRGDNYVRVVPNYPMPNAAEIRGYLEEILNEIREIQARAGASDVGELAKLSVKTSPDDAIIEIVYENLHTAVELLKAKAALKHVVDLGWQIYKAKEK
ncbi:MAG: hypothetical protein F7B95_00305 [Desulfurococcales archaeon]|nr:hypothetical protein [Desulfurococcales archaeon]